MGLTGTVLYLLQNSSRNLILDRMWICLFVYWGFRQLLKTARPLVLVFTDICQERMF